MAYSNINITFFNYNALYLQKKTFCISVYAVAECLFAILFNFQHCLFLNHLALRSTFSFLTVHSPYPAKVYTARSTTE